MTIRVSVIIPTLNRSPLLEKTLDSVKQQTLSQDMFEVIVIDNGSTDETRNVCNRYKSEFKHFAYFFEPNPGLHMARNRGFIESRSSILAYIDDDIIANPKWLETIILGFEDEDVMIVGGNVFPRHEASPPKWMKYLEKIDKKGVKSNPIFSLIEIGNNKAVCDPGYFFGCNFCVRKDVVRFLHGFHPDGVPKDTLMFRGDGESYITSVLQRISGKAMFYPEASIQHMVTKERMTYNYVKKVAFRSGCSEAYKLFRYENTKLGHIRFSFRILKMLFRSMFAQKKIIRLRESYMMKGMIFFASHYTRNDVVRDWVHKDNYLDSPIPV